MMFWLSFRLMREGEPVGSVIAMQLGFFEVILYRILYLEFYVPYFIH